MHPMALDIMRFGWLLLRHLLVIVMSIVFPMALILLVAMVFQPGFQFEAFVGSTVISSSLVLSAAAALLICPLEAGCFRHRRISSSTLWFGILIPGICALFASVWGALMYLHEHLGEYKITASFGAGDNVAITIAILCISLFLFALGSAVFELPNQEGGES